MRKNDGRKLDHQTLEAIRLRAVEQVEAGVPAAEVGRGLTAVGLHPKTIYTWLAKQRAEGPEALRARPVPGPRRKLTDEHGEVAGVMLTGIGGVGKSSIAGRAMTRLTEGGWVCSATTGTWSLETAVQRLAAHPARRFGLRDRGLLVEGLVADVVVFDPDAVADRSTYEDGRQLAAGVEHVVVNGELVLHGGERTAALPGRALRPG